MKSIALVLTVLAAAASAQEKPSKKPDPKETQALCGRLIAIAEHGISRVMDRDPSFTLPEARVREAMVGFDDLAGLQKLMKAEIEKAKNRKTVVENRARMAAGNAAGWRAKIVDEDLQLQVRVGVSGVVADALRKRAAQAAEAEKERLRAERRAEIAKLEAEAAAERARKQAEEQRATEESIRRIEERQRAAEERRRQADAALRASLRVGASAAEIDASGSLPSSVTTTTDAGGTIEIRTYNRLRLSLTFRNDVLVSWTESSR